MRHFERQKEHYGCKQVGWSIANVQIYVFDVQVIVNLVNQKGRERRVGGELERIALQANVSGVRYGDGRIR